MQNGTLHITIIPETLDSALDNPEYQKDLRDLEALLLPYKPKVPAIIKHLEAVAAPPGDLSGEVILAGAFLISNALPDIKEISKILLSWKKATGRQVALEVDGVKAKAQTVEQIAELFEIAEDARKKSKRAKHGK